MTLRHPEISLGHHWMFHMRGGERVLEQLCDLFPRAEILTLTADPARLSATLQARRIRCSWLDRVPGPRGAARKLLPLLPVAARSLRPRADCRFFLSSDASLFKTIRLPEGVVHVCYCHAPPRYLWEQEGIYLRSLPPGPARWIFRAAVPFLRKADARAALRVTEFIANSHSVAAQIKRYYGRGATVIHPPVAVEEFTPGKPSSGDYLFVSELVPYKRVDLAVEAFRRLPGRRLVIVGEGPLRASLQAHLPANVSLLGRQPFPVLKEHLERCRALVFPGVEDFGIVMAEAQAAGRPVIARGCGGVTDIVVDGKTGVLFSSPTAAALVDAVRRFEAEEERLTPEACRANAGRFSAERFARQIRSFLESRFPDLFDGFAWPAHRRLARRDQ